jgi:hypothetical protein
MNTRQDVFWNTAKTPSQYYTQQARPPDVPEALKIALYGGRHLRTPPKSEFVERERKFKSDWFRPFIYVKLRIAGEICKNLPFTRENA